MSDLAGAGLSFLVVLCATLFCARTSYRYRNADREKWGPFLVLTLVLAILLLGVTLRLAQEASSLLR